MRGKAADGWQLSAYSTTLEHGSWNLEHERSESMSCVKVKICGITRLQDALDACDLGADILGFNFVPASPRYLNPYTAREIISALPPFVTIMGVFADEELSVLGDMTQFLNLDALQLHGSEDARYCRKVKIPVIKALRVASSSDLEGLDEYAVSAYLLDARVPDVLGGSGQTFPWKVAKDFCRSKRVFVAGGLTPDNVGDAVRTLAPYGVDTASGVETEPGIKDPALVERFIKTARCAGIGNGGGCSEVAC
jgi:phosphoribosylanthranilate isomerase